LPPVTAPSANAPETAPGHSTGRRFGFIPLGIGDIFSRVHYPTSLLVFLSEERLMIDCPSPLPKILHEASTRSGMPVLLEDIRQVVLTHLHADHASGLECLGFYSRWWAKRRAIIWTLPEIAAEMWEHRLSASMAYDLRNGSRVEKSNRREDYFDVRPLDRTRATTICGAIMHIRQTRHAPICFGLKLYFDGRSLGYSSDTLFDREHIDFLADCDLIIHETGGQIHTPYAALAALPEPIRAKIRLIHVADEFDASQSVIPLLEEGRYYAL